MEANSFLPVFKGKFETVNGKTVLIGKWTYHWYTKIILFVIFSGITFNLFHKLIGTGSIPFSVLLVDAGILFVTWLLFKTQQKRSQKDKEWILQHVEHITNQRLYK